VEKAFLNAYVGTLFAAARTISTQTLICTLQI